MLRKLNTVPQPPLNSKLGERTRLYTIKTGGNLYRALGKILEQRESRGELPSMDRREVIRSYDEKMVKHGARYGQVIKRKM